MNHSTAAGNFIKDSLTTKWHDASLWMIRQKRDSSSHSIPDWEKLRTLAASVKDHTLSHLDTYLTQFESNAVRNGVNIHWARDAKEHNKIILDIIQSERATKVVKSKSMLTEECHLNSYLASHKIEVIDTDLGERIVQLAEEPPSHIVLPAIHKKKAEIGDLFSKYLHTPKGVDDPQLLTEAARIHLREKFTSAQVAITGVNFAVAETGAIVVCTNEGNADLGVHLADIHIASMGIEKLIPKTEHLGIFLRLLGRSATGQPITAYSSHFSKPKPGGKMHIVIVDNGRSAHLGMKDFWRALRCIRCGACMNTCPVYRRSGGHSYNYTIPGPIGSVLAPAKNLKEHSSLPFASTLCGSCTDVCPVKIDLHDQLYKWRQVIGEKNGRWTMKAMVMRVVGFVFSHYRLYDFAGKVGRKMIGLLPKPFIYNSLNKWGKQREIPAPPKESFKEWYIKNKKNGRQE